MRDKYLFVLIGLLSLSIFSFFFQLFFLKKESKHEEFTLPVKQEKVIPQKLEDISKGTETQNEIARLLGEIEKKEIEAKNLSDELCDLKNLHEKNKSKEKQDNSLEIKKLQAKHEYENQQKSFQIQALQAEIDRISKEKEKIIFSKAEKGVSSEDYEKVQKERDEYLEKTKEAKREFKKNSLEIERLKKENETEIERLKNEINVNKIALSELKNQLQAKNKERATTLPKNMAETEEREKALQEKILVLQSEISALTQKNLELSLEAERLLSEKRILDEERVLAKEKKEGLLAGSKELASQAINEAEGMFSGLSDEERKEPEEMLLLAKKAYQEKDYNKAFEQAARSAQKSYYISVNKDEREKVKRAGLAGTLLNILLLWR
jgi:chromosome segregation ATPase